MVNDKIYWKIDEEIVRWKGGAEVYDGSYMLESDSYNRKDL